VKAQHAVRDLVITHSGKEGGGGCYQRTEEREAIFGRWSGVSLGGTGYQVVRLERHQVALLCICLLLDGGSRAHHGVA